MHKAKFRRLLGLVLLGALLLCSGCQKPFVLESLNGRSKVFPDVLGRRPTVMAFLSANDRRCDKEILPLVSLYHRQGTPVQIMAVIVYDHYGYVKDVETLDQAVFTVLLDPDRRLPEKYGVDEYPTYVFLDIDGDELERVTDIREVRPWVDSPLWHEKALHMEPGTMSQLQQQQEGGQPTPASSGPAYEEMDPRAYDPYSNR